MYNKKVIVFNETGTLKDRHNMLDMLKTKSINNLPKSIIVLTKKNKDQLVEILHNAYPIAKPDTSLYYHYTPKYVLSAKDFEEYTVRWIHQYVYEHQVMPITPELEKDLQQTVLYSNYTLYRGLKWLGRKSKMEKAKQFINDILQSKLYDVGDTMEIKIKEHSSWTTDLSVAKAFAFTNFGYGIVLKAKVKSERVFADFRYTFSNNELKEQELILKPGNFKVEIVELQNDGQPVKSMKDWVKRYYSDDQEFANIQDYLLEHDINPSSQQK